MQVAANAPVSADGEGELGWHIDADPMLLPPSPWTDYHGQPHSDSNTQP